MSIRRFFTTTVKSAVPPRSSIERLLLFKPFEPVPGKIYAPTTRTKALSKEDRSIFDTSIGFNDDKVLYLDELRNGLRRRRSSKRTLPTEEPDIIIVSPDRNETAAASASKGKRKYRRKLLQFNEDRRPSKCGYFWRTSKIVNPRKPFAKDKNVFDYDVDSDDEWEQEEDGDDCKSDEEESEHEKEIDEEDKSFFVDHGYLSSSEGSDEEDADPESRRERGKVKMVTFQAELESRKMKHLRLITFAPNANEDNWYQKLGLKTISLSTKKPIPTSFTPGVVVEKKTPSRNSASSSKTKKKQQQTPRSEKRASLKRKIEGKEGGGKESKRGALSLS